MVIFLTRIAGKRNWRLVEANLQKLSQFPELAVGQRIHWVDDNSLDPFLLLVLESVINNGNDIGQAFAGASACNQHIAVATASGFNGLSLVPVQTGRATSGSALALAKAENVSTQGV